jgi:hypothetical protein
VSVSCEKKGKAGKGQRNVPLVVCLLSVSLITSNLVPNNRLRSVPVHSVHQYSVLDEKGGKKKRTLSRRLRPKHRDNVVVEPGVSKMPSLHVGVEGGAV